MVGLWFTQWHKCIRLPRIDSPRFALIRQKWTCSISWRPTLWDPGPGQRIHPPNAKQRPCLLPFSFLIIPAGTRKVPKTFAHKHTENYLKNPLFEMNCFQKATFGPTQTHQTRRMNGLPWYLGMCSHRAYPHSPVHQCNSWHKSIKT